MRNTLARIACLVALTALPVACTSFRVAKGPQTVSVSLKCTSTEIAIVLSPSTVIFHHTSLFNGPSDVDWKVDGGSHADEVIITPAAAWPLQGTPPFKATKSASHHGAGNSSQAKGIYHYSLMATCPNGITVTVDPDIVVD